MLKNGLVICNALLLSFFNIKINKSTKKVGGGGGRREISSIILPLTCYIPSTLKSSIASSKNWQLWFLSCIQFLIIQTHDLMTKVQLIYQLSDRCDQLSWS